MSDSEISTYPKTPRNTVQRYRNLAKYDHHTIHSIINSSPFLHVSFNTPSPSDPFPALLPMIGFAGKYNPQNPDEEDIGEGANIYIHGYVSSRLMRMGKSAGEGGGGGDDDDDEEEKGLPMTVAATCLDGLVLALAPYNHNYNYRSAVIQGYGQVVEDVDEKLWAMKR
ncbi:66d97b8f-63e1-4639-b7f2-79dc3e2d95cb [Sclerotinia trifoliorum]|uniref:66d97b8f-63e1-4639-b7f2-79dc3e2d95cb n=1 Tax=Sclerotinia trifoliorum TaxID=28548 RepID=A0A8H2ZSN6_9HELO|nr:66d97b8f-63e1-4639-b7f2-79dc3e2d95cb [Sclerotinia trifoliorum]